MRDAEAARVQAEFDAEIQSALSKVCCHYSTSSSILLLLLPLLLLWSHRLSWDVGACHR
jgi:hypothetical protein